MRAGRPQVYILYALLIGCLILNIALWQYSHRQKVRWPNVPKPPAELSLRASFLGDAMLAYRVWALALQNFGSSGGYNAPLKDYDYNYIGAWLDTLDSLDPNSDFAPFLAAYFFSGSQDAQGHLPIIIAYLEKAGSRPEGEKWRWLAQAMYLARHKLKDMDEALRLSRKLGDMYRPGMPAWTLQTEALITNEIVGDKEAAYVLLKAMLATEAEHMQGPEVNFMVDYICTKILTPQQAPLDPLCAEIKN
jgi:hypothetical protein